MGTSFSATDLNLRAVHLETAPEAAGIGVAEVKLKPRAPAPFFRIGAWRLCSFWILALTEVTHKMYQCTKNGGQVRVRVL